jgi:hypothetical protein
VPEGVGKRFVDALTGRHYQDAGGLYLKDVLAKFPVALLLAEAGEREAGDKATA